MGRPENSITPGQGPVEDFACYLRKVRADAGTPTYRQMAARSHYSASVLSRAAAGKQLPSAEVARAFAGACGADENQAEQQWAAAKLAVEDQSQSKVASTSASARHSDPSALTSVSEGSTPKPVRRLRRTHALAAAVVGLLAAGSWAGVELTGILGQPPKNQAAVTTVVPAADRSDPYVARCKADEKQLDWQPVAYPDGRPFGTLLLVYSPTCRAAWGYLNGPNSRQWTSHIVARRPADNASAPSQFRGDAALGSWGNVLSTRSGCVYAEAWISTSGHDGRHTRTACFAPNPTLSR
ncbi:helix-turn-helix domain-containing protein [Streptomyces sp. NPDC004393]